MKKIKSLKGGVGMKENKFNIVILLFLGVLCWESYRLEKKADKQMSAFVGQQQHVNDIHLMLESFVEMAPREMESIARQVSREEGIKLFKEFAANYRKLNEEPVSTPQE